MTTYSTEELQLFFQSWSRVIDGLTQLTAAFEHATDALTHLSDAFTPEMRLAIKAYEFDLSLSRIAAYETFIAWGIPALASQWLTRHLPDSVILHFAEMINK